MTLFLGSVGSISLSAYHVLKPKRASDGAILKMRSARDYIKVRTTIKTKYHLYNHFKFRPHVIIYNNHKHLNNFSYKINKFHRENNQMKVYIKKFKLFWFLFTFFYDLLTAYLQNIQKKNMVINIKNIQMSLGNGTATKI